MQAQLPLVYNLENTGEGCEQPVLVEPADLINYPMLPDPFSWSDGSGRLTEFEDWECRRNEIKAEIEKYEIGPKPNRPNDIKATFFNNILKVEITENGQTLTLTSDVVIPPGTGPFPVIIGMNSLTGSLPRSFFSEVIQISFKHDQVVTYSQTSNRNLNDPYYKLYPELTYVGNYSAWAWGVSRLIDGIELVKAELNADTEHIAVTGCSYAGKMALFSGAFDERIALTIAQESGGGGVNAWRVSETIGNVEKIDNTNYSWFMESLKTNFQGKVGILPYDHHELMAMIVPRALLVLGNPPYEWLGDESGYVSCRATEEVYKAFDISDRFGFSFRSGHDHCSFPSESNDELKAFIDKFLFGDETTNTNIRVHEFYNTDYNKWINAWKEPANPNTPSITLDSPEDNTVYESPATVTLTVTVNDPNNDMLKVEFYNKGKKIGESTSEPYSFTLTDIGVGSYSISAEALDSEGLRGYSNFVGFVVQNPTVDVHNVTTPPIIDGTIDLIWNNENVIGFEAKTELVGSDIMESNLSGTIKLLWDDNFVYFLSEVKDNAKQNDSQNVYEDDGIELYFDVNNSKSTPYDANDVQYSFRWNDGSKVGVLPNGRTVNGINYELVDTQEGYIIEGQIPWSVIQGTPEDGKKMGFDFMINDDDDGNGRDGKLSWNAIEDQAWQDASYFGTINLVRSQTTSFSEIKKNTSIESIQIYPNPVKKVIEVKGKTTDFEYKILGLNGQLLLSGKTDRKIKVDSLSKGVYLLKVGSDPDSYSFKFMKE